MSVAVDAASRPTPTNLRELLERVPRVLDAQAPRALHLESCASADVTETLSSAKAGLLKSAETFFKPLFRASLLENLGRDDPFAEPKDEEWPEAPPDGDLSWERRRLDGVTGRTVDEHPHLKASVEEVEERAAHLQTRMEELAMHVEVAPGSSPTRNSGGADNPALDTLYAAGVDEEARRADRKNEETLRLNSQSQSAAYLEEAAMQEKEAAALADFAREQREMDVLEREQAVALASAATEGETGDALACSPGGAAAGRRAEASRQTESLVGVAGMSEAELDTCVREEAALAERDAGIRDWYAGTVANLQLLVGSRVCHRLLFGTGAGTSGGVEGMEFMVELGPGKIMEITVSAADGSLSSVQLCHGQQSGGAAAAAAAAGLGAGGGITPSELEELRRTANALPAPQNLRMVVREAMSRARCVGLVEEHLRLMRGKYLIGHRAPSRDVTVTMGVGIVASLRLHVDYPKVAGGAEVVALTGVGGWSAMETEQLCRRVNNLALSTLMDTMEGLEAAVVSLEANKNRSEW